MGIAGPDADSIRFTGDKITALMWPSWNMIQLKEGSGHQTHGNGHWNPGHGVRNSSSSGQWWHMFLITDRFSSVPASPRAGGFVPSLSRHHRVSCQGICAGQGVLCPIRVCVLPTENKCQDRFGTALRGAPSQHGRYWILMGAAAGFYRKGTISILWKSSMFPLGRLEQPPKVICTTEEDVPRLWGSTAQPIGVGCSEQSSVPAKITAPGTTRD